MIIPLYRILEVSLYSLLNFIPFLFLALYPFFDSLRFRKRTTFCLIILLTLLQIALGLCSSFYPGNIAAILSLISTVSYALFYFLAVKKPVGKILFTLLMISNIANFTVVAAKCLEGHFFPELAVQPYRYSMSLFMIVVELCIGIPVFFYMKYIYAPAVSRTTAGHEWHYLWLIPATFYLIWYYTIYGNTTLSSLEIALRPQNAVVLFCINAGAFLVYGIVAKVLTEQDRILELQQQNHQLALQTLQYENLREKMDDARRARHDMRHHIAVFQNYMKEQDYAALQTYLNQYEKQLPDQIPLTFCENNAANAVLHYYAVEAASFGISYSVNACIPENCAIEKNDLAVLFGNLLENAMDACKVRPDTSGKILVRATYEKNSLCIAIDNSFDGNVTRTPDGAFLSTKHSGYGLGTASVRTIAEKYHGVCHFDWKDDMFYASVICFA